MLMNISEIKQRAGAVIDDRYDHRFLNEDNADFAGVVPTAENVARQLVRDVAPLFRDSGAELSAVHLEETPQRSATAYADGKVDANYEFRFSAARQTMSPNLSEKENAQLFGAAASPHGHGHDYRVRLTLAGEETDCAECGDAGMHRLTSRMNSIIDNLNAEVSGLAGRPMTTEVIAQYIFERASASLPLARVRLHERADFFAEYHASGARLLGMQMPFSAVHRLQSYEYTPEQNTEMYGKCNNPRGHGHLYVSEATIGGAFDERSGTMCNFTEFQSALREAVSAWDNRHLDLETEEFQEPPVHRREHRADAVGENESALVESPGAAAALGNGEQPFHFAQAPESLDLSFPKPGRIGPNLGADPRLAWATHEIVTHTPKAVLHGFSLDGTSLAKDCSDASDLSPIFCQRAAGASARRPSRTMGRNAANSRTRVAAHRRSRINWRRKLERLDHHLRPGHRRRRAFRYRAQRRRGQLFDQDRAGGCKERAREVQRPPRGRWKDDGRVHASRESRAV